MRSSRPRFRAAAGVAALLLGLLAPAAAAHTAALPSAQDEAGAVEAAAENEEEAAEEGPAWMKKIDGAMGDVNSALGKVIFWPIPIPGVREKNDAGEVVMVDGEGNVVSPDPDGGFTWTDDAGVVLRYTENEVEPKTIGVPLAVAVLVLGAIFFTLRMGFIQIRAFVHAIKVTAGKYDNPEDEGEVSHFQALSAALSATVGLGNIGGVAIAIGTGGPGATFWMIVAGFFGMASKFTECTLGQLYRETRRDGRVMGGAMHYLSKGFQEMGLGGLGKVLAIFFAIVCIGASFGGGNTFQVSQSLGALQLTIPFLDDYPWVYGILMSALVAVVILGGLRRIAATAEKVVPLMCGIYVLGALYILIANASSVPGAFGSIVSSAFTMKAGFGGFLGVLVIGFKRAAFSNEAGIGSAAIAHSAAKTPYAAREGIVALLEPFIDTIVVCTMTALVIVITGAYNNPDYAHHVAADEGAALTSKAMGQVISWFPYVLSAAVLLFAFSTMISWSYYGERCWAYLFGDGSSVVYRLLFIVFVFLGSVITAKQVLNFGDLLIFGMVFPNIFGVLLLSGRVKTKLDEYMAKLNANEFPTYK